MNKRKRSVEFVSLKKDLERYSLLDYRVKITMLLGRFHLREICFPVYMYVYQPTGSFIYTGVCMMHFKAFIPIHVQLIIQIIPNCFIYFNQDRGLWCASKQFHKLCIIL